MNRVELECTSYREMAKKVPNQELLFNQFGLNLKLIYIPDIIDRFQWFSDNIAISESYARILIERAFENGDKVQAD